MAAQGAQVRRHFSTFDPADFASHDHVAWCGEGPEDLDRLAVATFTAAARRGEQMVFITEDPDPGRLAGLADRDEHLAHGTLRLATIEEGYGGVADVEERLAYFAAQVDRCLEEGRSGMCVVADDTGFVSASDEEFADWLSWELASDGLQATRPLSGVCFFDVSRIPAERMRDLATIHPVLSQSLAAPEFQLFRETDGAVRVSGSLDSFSVEQLRRVLPRIAARELDLVDVEFINHRALFALLGPEGGAPRRVRNAPRAVRRLVEVLGIEPAVVEFA